MAKNYFDRKSWEAGRKAEAQKSSNGIFFSSKEDNDEYFNNSKGTTLTVVGLAPIPARAENKEKNIDAMNAYNVVLFDDGHQLSTNRFFNARGLKWPVGGNTAKWDYLTACLINGTKISVVPKSVIVGDERETRDGRKFTPVTYCFEEMEKPFPATDMSVLKEEEKSE